MKRVSPHKPIVHLIAAIILTACATARSNSSPVGPDALQDMMLDFNVKALHSLIDPDSAFPISGPTYEVDCTSDEEHKDCCTATGKMEVEVPVQDFIDKIKDELLKAITDESQKQRDQTGRMPALPEDIEWAIQVNEKIAEKIIEEWFAQNPKVEIIFSRSVITSDGSILTAGECEEILQNEIRQYYPPAFKAYYQSLPLSTEVPSQPFQWQFPISTEVPSQPFQWQFPNCRIVPIPPFFTYECQP